MLRVPKVELVELVGVMEAMPIDLFIYWSGPSPSVIGFSIINHFSFLCITQRMSTFTASQGRFVRTVAVVILAFVCLSIFSSTELVEFYLCLGDYILLSCCLQCLSQTTFS